MKPDSFELTLERSPMHRDFYIAGEEIKGLITIKVPDEKVRIARLSLRVLGTAHCAWLDSKHSGMPCESVELIMDEYRDLTGDVSIHCSEIMELFAGECNVRFQFKLPLDAVSSIDKEGYGNVRYCCVASLDVPEEGGDSEIVAEVEFPVVAYLNLDSPHFRDPVHASEQIAATGVFCGRPRGWARADLFIGEMGLLPGETCEVTLTVENTVKKASRKKHRGEGHQCALVSLCQQIEFRARAKQKPNAWQRRTLTTAVQSHGTCKANCTKRAESRKILFQIPKNLPPTSNNVNRIIACAYFFRVEMNEHFDVVAPIVIGSQKTKSEPKEGELNPILECFSINEN